MLKAHQEAWGAADPLREKFTKEEKAAWSKEDKRMFKTYSDLHGLNKATYTMRKLFAKRAAIEAGEPEPEAKKPPPKKKKLEMVLINSAAEPADGAPGQLLIGGTLDFDTCTSNKAGSADAARNLWSYHRTLCAVQIRLVAAGPTSCHTIAISAEGQAFGWGRNKHGQLGLGDTEMRTSPSPLDGFGGQKMAAAACGRKHTLWASEAGKLYAAGCNTDSQLGVANDPALAEMTVGGKKEQCALTPCVVKGWGAPVTRVSCGGEFSAAVNAQGALAVWGRPEYGQLGNGTTGEFIAAAGQIGFACVETPEIRQLQSPTGCTEVADVACGSNHTLALMRDGSVFSWGFGGYGRLGHHDAADQLSPKLVADLGPAALRSGMAVKMISAGASCSFACSQTGVTFFWGTNKPSAEATLSPKTVEDLTGWNVRSIGCGNSSTIVAADNSVIAWGPSPTFGELGYGDPLEQPKSSTKPKLVDSMEGIKVHSLTVGYGHCALVAEASAKTSELPEWTEAGNITGNKRGREDQ